MDDRLVGITVLPEFIQYESVQSVLDNLIERAGVTAIATSPYVMEPADETTGGREPPIDAGAGSVRLLDRPLWGKRELWVRTAPSFTPRLSLYSGLRYQPPKPDELTKQQGNIIAEFIQAAQARGLRVFFQVQAAIPPGYRVQFGGPTEDDAPRLPNGRIADRRVAKNASLASPQVLDYQRALIRDLAVAYPDINGIRFDWPEYPPYLVDTAFFDFSEHAQQSAKQEGLNFEAMQRDSQKLYEKLHGGLTNEDLQHWLDTGARGWHDWLLAGYPGALDMLLLKSLLSEQLLSIFRTTMNETFGSKTELAPSAFPPPWSSVSGLDFARAAKYCDSVSVKLYGMHWAMMTRFYGDQIREANPQIETGLLTQALLRLLDITDQEDLSTLEDIRYPGPDEPHLAGVTAQKRKIAWAQQRAGDLPVHVLAHGYGPVEDFRHRIETAFQASQHGVWVNRYGYLSDAKLDAIGDAARNIS